MLLSWPTPNHQHAVPECAAGTDVRMGAGPVEERLAPAHHWPTAMPGLTFRVQHAFK